MNRYPTITEYKAASITTSRIGNYHYEAIISGVNGIDEPIVLPNLKNSYIGVELGRKLIDEHSEKHYFYTENFQVTKQLKPDNTWSYSIYEHGHKVGGMDYIQNTTDLLAFATREANELDPKRRIEETLPIKMTYRKIIFEINKEDNNTLSLTFKDNFPKSSFGYSLTLMRHSNNFGLPKESDTPSKLPPPELPKTPIKNINSINEAINLAKKIIDFCKPKFNFSNGDKKLSLSSYLDDFSCKIREGETVGLNYYQKTIQQAINEAFEFETNPRNK